LEVLNTLITHAANEAGFAVETAEQHGSDVIQSTIINRLLQADLVIADITDHNPNVMFELGIRMAREKPVQLIRADGTPRIFDVDNMLRVYTYSPNLWATTVERDRPRLADHIKATWDNRTVNRSYMQILVGGVQPVPPIGPTAI
jgi:nucleoside 2-deoxyribosyltransferase